MSKEARPAVVLDDEAQKTFQECVAALTAMCYGPEGPPADTTFAEIEEFGHEVGRMLGRAVIEYFGDVGLDEVSPGLADEYARSLLEQLAPATAQKECQIAAQFFRHGLR